VLLPSGVVEAHISGPFARSCYVRPSAPRKKPLRRPSAGIPKKVSGVAWRSADPLPRLHLHGSTAASGNNFINTMIKTSCATLLS